MLLEYVDNFSSSFQRATDTIASETEDPAVRRETVEWKLRTIPLCRRIVLDNPPREAFLDLWALTLQLEDYVKKKGDDSFEGHKKELVSASREAVEGIEAVAKSILDEKEFKKARSDVDRFATEHPITGSFVRRSHLPSSEKGGVGISFAWVGSIPIIGAFDGLDEGAKAVRQVALVAERFSRIVEAMPQELRWQIELILYDIEARSTVIDVREALTATSAGIQSFAETAARLPDDMSGVIDTTLTELETQREGLNETLQEVDGVLDRGEELSGSLERTAESLARAGVALEAMAVAFMGPAKEPGVAEPAPAKKQAQADSGAGKGFDIDAYTHSADSITQGAIELRALVSELRSAAGSEEFDILLAGTQSRMDEFISRVTRAVIGTVAAVLLAALCYRFVSARWMSGRAS